MIYMVDNKDDKYFSVVLRKMFSAVGADPDKFAFKMGWYMKHSWTSADQDKFRKWFIAYLKKNKAARKEICPNARPTLNTLGQVADQFLLSWGWKVDESPYPEWVCTPCGFKASLKCKTKRLTCSTVHLGICEVCGDRAGVTEPRDFGYPSFPNIIKRWKGERYE